MQAMIDILASGIHDAKNQLLLAESLVADAETRHAIELSEARYAIEASARRLSQTLVAYRLAQHERPLAIQPCIIADLIEEIAQGQRPHIAHRAIRLEIDCQVVDAWPIDRELVTDMLNNAVQNASRHARQRILLRVVEADDGLELRVEDDGPGFSTLPPTQGIGLQLAESLAALHQRHGRTGMLRLHNNGLLGGASFTLWLP